MIYIWHSLLISLHTVTVCHWQLACRSRSVPALQRVLFPGLLPMHSLPALRSRRDPEPSPSSAPQSRSRSSGIPWPSGLRARVQYVDRTFLGVPIEEPMPSSLVSVSQAKVLLMEMGVRMGPGHAGQCLQVFQSQSERREWAGRQPSLGRSQAATFHQVQNTENSLLNLAFRGVKKVFGQGQV